MPVSTSWDDYRLVKAIADAGSLVGAATVLGLNHSTIFRRLGGLEAALNTRLFERARGGYQPTAAGEEMIALAQRMGQDIVDFERRIAGRDIKPAGELRVTTNDGFLVHLLTPIFASFRNAYPDISLDVVVANEPLNLSRRDADIAIRATAKPPDTLVGRRIARSRWAIYAPTAWGDLEGSADSEARPWIGFGGGLAAISAALWLDRNIAARRIVYRVNTVIGLIDAVAAGIGMALLPCFVGDEAPGLTRLGAHVADVGEELWLLTHADLRHSARVRAFMDHAGLELAKLRAIIEGE